MSLPTGAMAMKGALWKQSDHFKTWRRRYLELFPSHILYWEGDAPDGTTDPLSQIYIPMHTSSGVVCDCFFQATHAAPST
jgi:hypothetical protein